MLLGSSIQKRGDDEQRRGHHHRYKHLPREIFLFLRKEEIPLQGAIAKRVNNLHISVEIPAESREYHWVWISAYLTGMEYLAGFGISPNSSDSRGKWTFATGELWRAADTLCRRLAEEGVKQ